MANTTDQVHLTPVFGEANDLWFSGPLTLDEARDPRCIVAIFFFDVLSPDDLALKDADGLDLARSGGGHRRRAAPGR